jgi:hypothetical protein
MFNEKHSKKPTLQCDKVLTKLKTLTALQVHKNFKKFTNHKNKSFQNFINHKKLDINVSQAYNLNPKSPHPQVETFHPIQNGPYIQINQVGK